ncbi:MAG: cadherin-like beta sandwich domain-containing protein, partial [Gammaproteobacteria bacterium]
MFRSINNKLIYPITIFIALTLTACGGGSGGGSDGGVTPPPAATKADLSGLTLSAGTLMPPLQAGITSHTVNSPDDVSVTPVAQTDARMTVNGADVDSGETVALVEGANTIVVTHLDLTKTYTITINRLAASAFNQPARKAGAGKFAKQVALDGNTLVVGAPDANTVHIFVADGSGAWLPE